MGGDLRKDIQPTKERLKKGKKMYNKLSALISLMAQNININKLSV